MVDYATSCNKLGAFQDDVYFFSNYITLPLDTFQPIIVSQITYPYRTSLEQLYWRGEKEEERFPMLLIPLLYVHCCCYFHSIYQH